MSKEIGLFIRKYRKKEKMSGIELSKEIGLTSGYISQIETGKIKLPSKNIMIKLARHLNIPFQKMMQITGYSLDEVEVEEETAKQKEIKKERDQRKAIEKREYTKKLREDHQQAEVIRKEKVAQEKERLAQKRQLKKEERMRNAEEAVNPPVIETSETDEQQMIQAKAVPQENRILTIHPLDVLLSLPTPILADLFLTHMRKGKAVYHTYLMHALEKGLEGNGSSREILDLLIANHADLLHLDVFQEAIIRQMEPSESTPPGTTYELKGQRFYPLWKKAYFADDELKDYGDYVLSSHNVEVFELEPLLKSNMVLLNGRIVNPNIVSTIKALLFETANQ